MVLSLSIDVNIRVEINSSNCVLLMSPCNDVSTRVLNLMESLEVHSNLKVGFIAGCLS
jgi:hypothetical protein